MEGENVCEKIPSHLRVWISKGEIGTNDETYRKHIRTDAYNKITKIKLIFNIN